MRVTIQTNPGGTPGGTLDEVYGESPQKGTRGTWSADTNDASSITGVTLLAKTSTFNIGSKVKAYVFT